MRRLIAHLVGPLLLTILATGVAVGQQHEKHIMSGVKPPALGPSTEKRADELMMRKLPDAVGSDYPAENEPLPPRQPAPSRSGIPYRLPMPQALILAGGAVILVIGFAVFAGVRRGKDEATEH